LSFNVMIEPNDIVRYRGDMQPAAHRAHGCRAAATASGELLRHPEVLRGRQAPGPRRAAIERTCRHTSRAGLALQDPPRTSSPPCFKTRPSITCRFTRAT
jgi:hypothetical protein